MINKIWVFGHSFCLPFNLEDNDNSWVGKLANRLGLSFENFSEPGADNLFIYHAYRTILKRIRSEDIVIIGWSHPSRKSFVLDQENPRHTEVSQKGLLYECGSHKFFRSNNPTSYGSNNWLNFKPKKKGLLFYDDWFNNYYSEYEQKLNFQSYIDSVVQTCPGIYLPFYFNQESVSGINTHDTDPKFMVEFIKENNIKLNKTDMHMNNKGHDLWSEVMHQKYLTMLK